MNWKAYPAYVPSGLEWLDDLPHGWTKSGISTLRADGENTFTDGDWVETPYITDSGIRLIQTGNVGTGEYREQGFRYVSESTFTELRCKEVLPGDLLICRLAEPVGRSCVAPDLGVRMITSVDVCILRTRNALLTKYLNYLFNCAAYQGYVSSLVRGGTRDRISRKMLGRFQVPLPPPDTIAAITSFLDAGVSKIDALIAKQEQLIATLREDRAATITHAVTKGLDFSVDLVQPHNSELPTCPSHWTAQIPLKRLAEVQTGLTLGKSVDPAEAVEVPYLRVANVQTSGVDLDEVKTVAVHRSELSRYLLRGGDVLMTEGGDIDKLGRGCVWSGEISPCIHQNHVFAVRCKDRLSSAFLVYLLDTAVARNYFFMTAKKTTNLASTNSTTLGAFTFSLPPRAEQDEIVGHLNERCAGLDALIAKANAVIEVLREYRAALITDAVTGKLDVRGAVA
ncbi:restriction endonuclease subunit S [Mycolicibacterium gadium]|uniref:Restriction endonuclease subunit S n=1 Tax=Mycolicibacterium gadium TaxID=1794 RepID=A0ABT6GPY7_MYCGU|nr:restriction endonuclease subunit S [Mycolicibacterium gadium]MDG5483350.1 restriction endonuclease subunit S [Mycolicibacterium gadium]